MSDRTFLLVSTYISLIFFRFKIISCISYIPKDSPLNIVTIVTILEAEAGIQPPKERSKSLSKRSPKSRRLEPHQPPGISTSRASYHELQLQARSLLTFLKYSNRHLKDASTPKSIQDLFKTIQ